MKYVRLYSKSKKYDNYKLQTSNCKFTRFSKALKKGFTVHKKLTISIQMYSLV